MHQQAIIQFLKEASGYISGEDISRQLHLSRAAIWKHMHQLREQGYEIEAVPHLGYRLMRIPDKLLVAEIQDGLKTKHFGRVCLSYETIDSTMDEAFRLAGEGLAHGALICAETQTKGRGRMGRTWMSPPRSGLYVSLVLRPQWPLQKVTQLTLTMSIAVLKTLQDFCGVEARVKWPNDILIKGKKVAGLLTEMRAESDAINFVVLGLGLNVHAADLETATSIKDHHPKTVDRVKILRALLLNMEKWYDMLDRGRFDEVLQCWIKNNVTLQQRVRVTDGQHRLEGLAVGLDKNGALLIKQDGGKTIKVFSGEITVLRGAHAANIKR